MKKFLKAALLSLCLVTKVLANPPVIWDGNCTSGIFNLPKNACLVEGVAGSGPPGGSDTQVQFNDGGSFGGASSVLYDKTNKYFAAGINPTGPVTLTHSFQVGGGNAYLAPTSAAGVITYATPKPTPTSATATGTYQQLVADSASFIAATQNDGAGAYTADGTNAMNYYVAAYVTVDGVKLYSPGLTTIAFLDNSDASPFSVDLSWNAVSGATGYRIWVTGGIWGATYPSIDVGAATTYTDTGSGLVVAPYPPTPNSLAYLANGSTYTYHIYDYFTAFGVNLFSTGFKSQAFTDDHRSQHAPSSSTSVINTASGTYPSNGYLHQYKIYAQYADGGSSAAAATTSVTDPGNYVIGNVGGQSATINYAEAGYTAIGNTFTYDVYAYFTSPGGVVYSAAGGVTNSPTDDSSTNPYAVDLAWNPVTGANGYLIFISGGPHAYTYDFYHQVTGGATVTYIDDDSGWVADTTTYPPTPTTIPFTYQVNVGWAAVATATNYLVLKAGGDSAWTYNFYFSTASTSFSDTDDSIWTAYAGSDPPLPTEKNTYLDVHLGWSTVTGGPTYRILRDINGGGFTGGYDTASTSLIDGNFTALFTGPISVANTLYHATGANHTIKAYSFNNADATYSSTHADNSVTDNNSGNYYSIDWTASNYPASVDKLKFVIDSTNGELLTSPTLAYTDTNGAIAYNSNTTVTPNTVGAKFYSNTTGAVVVDTLTASTYVNTPKIGTGTGLIQIGSGSSASATDSIAIGLSTTASGGDAVAVGALSTATANSSAAFGIDSHATGAGSIAIGSASNASSTDSISIGDGAAASGGSVGIGAGVGANGLNTTAIGPGAHSSSFQSAAFGFTASSTGVAAAAIGFGTHGYGDESFAGGYLSTASGTSDIALGDHASCSGGQSVCIGKAATGTGAHDLVIGDASSASGQFSTAIGYASSSDGGNSIAFGFGAGAHGNNCMSFGVSTSCSSAATTASVFGNTSSTASTNTAVVGTSSSISTSSGSSGIFGKSNTIAASSPNSYAVGQSNSLTGAKVYAFGDGNTLSNANSMVLGFSGTAPAANTIDIDSLGGINLKTTSSTVAITGNESISGLTASRAVATDGSKVLVSSATTSTELGYVNGVTSAIQTQLNAKQATLTTGNLTDAGTDGITVTGGTGAVIGSGTSLSQHVADSTHAGYLSSTDWTTFNSNSSAATSSLTINEVASASHLISHQTTTPTTTPNANLGTGGTCTVANSTDIAGTVTLTVGTGISIAAGAECAINFNQTYGVAPKCLISPATSTTALAGIAPYVTSSTSALTIDFGAAGVTTVVYVFNYHCIETQ